MVQNTTDIILNRAQLYDLVWSKPMLQLAEELGISDRGLAKKCLRHKVPVPYRGYWAKIEAGKKARKYPLPKSNDDYLDHIRFVKAAAPEKALKKVLDFPLPADLNNKIESFDVLSAPRKRHDLISTTRKLISKKAGDRYGFLNPPKDGLALKVTSGSLDQAIDVFSQIISFCAHLGWKVENLNGQTCVRIDGQPIPLRIKERIKQVEHTLTDQEKADNKTWKFSFAPKYDYLSTGELSIEIDQYNTFDQKSIWKIDAATIDTQLRELMVVLWTIAQWSYESELVLNQRKTEEAIAAKEHARREHVLRVQQNRIKNLQSVARSWKEIQELESFLKDAESRFIGNNSLDKDSGILWISWAKQTIEELSETLLDNAVKDDIKIANEEFFYWGR
jgi:hypothetical protein